MAFDLAELHGAAKAIWFKSRIPDSLCSHKAFSEWAKEILRWGTCPVGVPGPATVLTQVQGGKLAGRAGLAWSCDSVTCTCSLCCRRPRSCIVMDRRTAAGLAESRRPTPHFHASACSRHAEKPYHNAWKAVETMHMMYWLITRGGLDRMTPLNMMALLVGALASYVSSPGLSNAFLIAKGDPIAVRFNDSSPLENLAAATGEGNHACDVGCVGVRLRRGRVRQHATGVVASCCLDVAAEFRQLLNAIPTPAVFEVAASSPSRDIFASMSADERREIRRVILKTMLATDGGRRLDFDMELEVRQVAGGL